MAGREAVGRKGAIGYGPWCAVFFDTAIVCLLVATTAVGQTAACVSAFSRLQGLPPRLAELASSPRFRARPSPPDSVRHRVADAVAEAAPGQTAHLFEARDGHTIFSLESENGRLVMRVHVVAANRTPIGRVPKQLSPLFGNFLRGLMDGVDRRIAAEPQRPLSLVIDAPLVLNGSLARQLIQLGFGDPRYEWFPWLSRLVAQRHPDGGDFRLHLRYRPEHD